MIIKNLRTYHQLHPIGIDANPYFSWQLESSVPNTKQTAYRFKLFSEKKELIYDSQQIVSEKNCFLTLENVKLESNTDYEWTVSVTDNHGETSEATANFATGLLHQGDWTASWVKAPFRRRKPKSGFGKQAPASLFRKMFRVDAMPVRARLYATCHGIYEAYLNQKRIDDRFFAPEHTVYEKYLCAQCYDITDQLSEGDNCIGFQVANGWYMCANTLPNMKKNDYRHAVLFQLEIDFADGTHQTIGSDETVECATGAVRSADLFAGEWYDANFERINWCSLNRDRDTKGDWKPCETANDGKECLVPQSGEPVRVYREIPAKSVHKSPKGEWILDFGQNLAGVVRMHVDVPAGTTITLDHCEVLDKDGNYFNNLLSAGGVGKGVDQKDVYVSNGTSTAYCPRFTYHGFRYVRVNGIEPRAEDFTALALSTEKRNIGKFHTSEELINRLYENIRWSQTSNMLSIPTDCPQREKAGWTGDMLVYAKTAMQNEDCTNLFSRWLANVTCDQDRYGIVPMVVPQDGAYPSTGRMMNLMFGAKGSGTSSGWGDAAVIVPYSMYEITGNTEILKRQYYSMRRWCDYIILQAKTKRPKYTSLPDEIEAYLWDTGFHYGEWLIPSQSKNGLDTKHLKEIMASSSCYTAPIFGWRSVSTFARICSILNEKEVDHALYASDAETYQVIADRMKHAIQEGVIGKDELMPSTLMGAYVLPLYFDLVPEDLVPKFKEKLIQTIRNNQMCLDTGFLTTPYLLDTLCKIGHTDLASQLLWQTKKPSWLYEVKAGGTTMWENCYGYDEENNPGNLSFNHYSFGAVADWIFRTVGGITPLEAGYTKVKIEPIVTLGIDHCEREFETMQGTISCKWETHRQGNEQVFCMDVEIPCNTDAIILLPDHTTNQVGSGTYHYEAVFAETK